jgi:hypothetical protein
VQGLAVFSSKFLKPFPNCIKKGPNALPTFKAHAQLHCAFEIRPKNMRQNHLKFSLRRA